jgi:lambda family phage tail tape measure protein
MATIGSLSVKLGLITVEWDQATAKAKQQAKDLQKAFNALGVDLSNLKNLFNNLGGGLGLTAAGFAAMVKSTIQFSGQLDDVAKSFDVSIAKLLQFQSALVQAGGRSEDATKIIGKMFDKLAAAQSGNEAAIASFEQLGITFEELQSMTPDAAIGRIYEGLAKVGSTFERIKLVKEFLGKGGLGKSVEEIAAAMGQSTAEYERHSKAIERMATVGDELDATFKNLKIAFADLLAPFKSGDMVVGVDTIKSAIIGIGSAMAVGGIWKLTEAMLAFVKVLRETVSLGAALSVAGGLKSMVMAGAGLAAYYGSQKYFEMQDKGAPAAGAPSAAALGGAGGGTDQGRAELLALQDKVNMTKELVEIEKKRAGIRAMADKDAAGMAEAELNRQQAILQARQTYQQAMAKENLSEAQKAEILKQYQADTDMANAKARTETSGIAANRSRELEILKLQANATAGIMILDQQRAELEVKKADMSEWEYQREMEKINLAKTMLELQKQLAEVKARTGGGAVYEAEANAIKQAMENEKLLSEVRMQNIALQEERSKTWAGGWTQAMQSFQRDAEQYGKAGADSFNSVVSNMNTAIDNFVQNGTFSFRQFALSVIKDLIAIQMKMQAMALMSMGLKFLTGAFGGGMVSGTGYTDVSPTSAGTFDFGGSQMTITPTAADGGLIGGPTLVGENGPELFIPQSSGTVIPNQQLSSYMGNQPQVVYNGPYIQNMQAIDTQSATQFLARNKDAVYSANMSASRSMPTSTR